jgi:hypothetical protein
MSARELDQPDLRVTTGVGTARSAGRLPHGSRDGDRGAARHYSLLQTIEQNFGLPLLGNAGDLVQVGNLSSLLR